MAANLDARNALIQHLENMIVQREIQIAPLESGEMSMGYRVVAGSEWVNNTKPHTEIVRNEIATLRNAIARICDSPVL